MVHGVCPALNSPLHNDDNAFTWMECPTNSKNWLFLDFDNGGNNQFEVANADGEIILKSLNIVKTGTTVSDDGAYVLVIAHRSSRVINIQTMWKVVPV